MILLATVSITFYFVLITLTSLKISPRILLYIEPLRAIFDTVNYGLMFRFVRLQVQLRACQENSKKIFEAIHRSKKVECFVYIDLTIKAIALLLNNIAGLAMEESEIRTHIIYITLKVRSITYLIFLWMFSLQFECVNKQLAKYFDLVSDKSYPKKSITTILVTFLIIGSITRLFLFNDKDISIPIKIRMIIESVSLVYE